MVIEEPDYTVIKINLTAIAKNYNTIRKYTGSNVECSAVVKANAYGLGANQISLTLYKEGCKTFFVATTKEGKDLREFLEEQNKNIKPNILVFNGPNEKNITIFKKYNLIPVLNSIEQLILWNKFISNNSFVTNDNQVAIHLDTGMNRLGLQPQDIEIISNDITLIQNINIQLIMSHFACAENINNKKNIEQLNLFDKLKKKLPTAPASIANSAATLANKRNHYDLIRTGIALYGFNPINDEDKILSETILLQSRIIQIKSITKPSSVGYGATYKVNKPTKIATIPVGYADGFPRNLSNIGFVIIEETLVPIIGLISMDLLVVNISHVKTEVGAQVILMGGGININSLAKSSGTIAYELLTGLSNRYPRIYNYQDVK